MLSDRIEELARLHKPRPNSVTPEFAGFCNRDYEQYPCSIAALLPVLRAAVGLAQYTAWTFPAESSEQIECAFCEGHRPKHNAECPYAALVAAVEEAGQ